MTVYGSSAKFRRLYFGPALGLMRHGENASRRGKKGRERTYELVCEHENGLERKIAVTHAKEVFKRRTEQVNDHDVVIALSARVHDPGDAGTTHKSLVDL